MKKTFSLLFISLIGFTLFAQNSLNSKSTISFRNAKASYENKEYGKALKYAEDAILYKKEQQARCVWRITILIQYLYHET